MTLPACCWWLAGRQVGCPLTQTGFREDAPANRYYARGSSVLIKLFVLESGSRYSVFNSPRGSWYVGVRAARQVNRKAHRRTSPDDCVTSAFISQQTACSGPELHLCHTLTSHHLQHFHLLPHNFNSAFTARLSISPRPLRINPSTSQHGKLNHAATSLR